MVTESKMGWAIWLMLGGAVGLAAVSYATVAANVPTIASPFSLTVVLPFLSVGAVAFGVWPLAFLLWCVPLFSRASAIPHRSVVFAGAAWVFGAVWLGVNWRDGISHAGVVQVATLLALDSAVAILLFWLIRRGRREPSFLTNYAFHRLLFAWVAWGSAPWLGEGI